MLDLIVRKATLADGRRGIDVGMEAGRIGTRTRDPTGI